MEGNKNHKGGKTKGQAKGGPNITLARLNIQTHNDQLGSKMVKSNGNKGRKVKDVNVVCQHKKKRIKEIARHQNELK